MKRHSRCFVFGLMVLGLVIGAASAVPAGAITISMVDGNWRHAVCSDGSACAIINNDVNNGPLAKVKWGTPAVTGGYMSQYHFLEPVTAFNVNPDGQAFELATFTHANYPVTGPTLRTVELNLKIKIADLVTIEPDNFLFTHNETENDPSDPLASRDKVRIVNPVVNQVFTYGGSTYYFNLLGFSTDNGNTITTRFLTYENQDNTAGLYAKITTAPITTPEPTTILLLGFGMVGLAAARRLRK